MGTYVHYEEDGNDNADTVHHDKVNSYLGNEVDGSCIDT